VSSHKGYRSASADNKGDVSPEKKTHHFVFAIARTPLPLTFSIPQPSPPPLPMPQPSPPPFSMPQPSLPPFSMPHPSPPPFSKERQIYKREQQRTTLCLPLSLLQHLPDGRRALRVLRKPFELVVTVSRQPRQWLRSLVDYGRLRQNFQSAGPIFVSRGQPK
jgi:hypothetical protein